MCATPNRKNRVARCADLISGTKRRFGWEEQADPRAASVTAGDPRPHPAWPGHGTVPIVSSKAERHAARERVSAYHQSQLAGLLSHVGAALDRYRGGEIDAYAMDEAVLVRY